MFGSWYTCTKSTEKIMISYLFFHICSEAYWVLCVSVLRRTQLHTVGYTRYKLLRRCCSHNLLAFGFICSPFEEIGGKKVEPKEIGGKPAEPRSPLVQNYRRLHVCGTILVTRWAHLLWINTWVQQRAKSFGDKSDDPCRSWAVPCACEKVLNENMSWGPFSWPLDTR